MRAFGYHGSNRDGHLVILDTNRGREEAAGIIQRISGRDLPLDVKYMDRLTENVWPKFLTPRPITDTVFLVSARMEGDADSIGLYLADTSDRLNLLHARDGCAMVEPVPVMRRSTPPVVAERVLPGREEAAVFLQDIYVGPGLSGVPRGAIKGLRVIGYDFGYIGARGHGQDRAKRALGNHADLGDHARERRWIRFVPRAGQYPHCLPGAGWGGKDRSTHAKLVYCHAG